MGGGRVGPRTVLYTSWRKDGTQWPNTRRTAVAKLLPSSAKDAATERRLGMKLRGPTPCCE